MEALLGASQANPSCASVPDLQGRLRDLLGSRATETRVEHTSVTFEIRATASFDIPIVDSENGENASNIDPVLGGAQPVAAVPGAAYANGAQPTRRVNAIDALINQPVDDPALQTTIVRHIIASLSAVDGSNWIVRQVSRGEQGWTFTYICKDSWRAWSRTASKNPAKTAIGEWSDKGGQDPVHLARPAFDCRGSVKIAFAKSSKVIEVKYEHTPMHKTVAELIELIAPPPLAPIVKTPAKKAREPKPKTPRPPKRTPGTEGESQPKRRRKKDSQAADGAAGDGSAQPKTRRKKKDAQPATPGGTVLPPEMPGALPVGNGSARQLYNAQAGAAQSNGSSSYPEGLVGSANDGDAGAADDKVHAHSMLNLPPGEAARRREVAIGLLRESDIDPKSLSAEQFSIFANQSPELQQDSLTMLRKYGAERLRIVHPNKEGSSSGQSTPNAQGTPTPAEASLPKQARKKKSDAAGDEEAASGTSHKGRMCDNCRSKKYKGKCDKKRPSCSMCLAEGEACVYPIPKRQRKSEGPALEAPAPAPAVEPEVADDGPDDLGSPGFHTAQVSHQVHDVVDHSVNEPVQEQYDPHVHHATNEPVSDHHQVPETPSDAFNYAQDMYQHPSGLTFPRASAASTTEFTHSTSSSAAMGGYMSNSISEAPTTALHNYDYSQPAAPQPTSGYVDHTTSSSFEHTRRGSSGAQAMSSRRNLQTSQAAGSGVSGSGLDAQSAWTAVSANPPRPTPATRTSPRQSRNKRPAAASQHDDLQQQQQQASSSANQVASRSTPPVRNSPVQVAAQPARAKSQQTNRAQGHTPVDSMPVARKLLPQGPQSLADNSGYATATTTTQQQSSAQTYNNYNQYQTEASQTDGSSDRTTAYQPYSHTHTTPQPATYSSFDEYNNERAAANTASSTLSAQASQNVASSYPSNSAATTRMAQWGTSTTTPQTGYSRPYMPAQSTTDTNSYNTTSTTAQQPQSLQNLNLRPQSQTQTRSSSNTYTQQPQQQQPQRQQQQRQQGYTGYITQLQAPQLQAPQQQQQHTASNNQQSWGYGFGNSSSSEYNSTSGAGAATSSHGHDSSHTGQQQQQQQHRSLHHGELEHDTSLYDLLGRNPAG